MTVRVNELPVNDTPTGTPRALIVDETGTQLVQGPEYKVNGLTDVDAAAPGDGQRMTFDGLDDVWKSARSKSALNIQAFLYRFRTGGIETPVAGDVTANDATLNLATVLYVNKLNVDGEDASAFLSSLADGATISFIDRADEARFVSYDVTAGPTLVGDIYQVPVSFVSEAGDALIDNLHVALTFRFAPVPAGSVEKLNDLTDVNVPTPGDGQRLAWDELQQLWIAKRSVSALGIVSFPYKWATGESETPAVGDITSDSPTANIVTTLYINKTDSDTEDLTLYLENLELGSWINLYDRADSDTFVAYDVTGPPVVVGDIFQVPVTFFDEGGLAFTNNLNITLFIRYTGAQTQMPAGGLTGQVLTKASDDDYDTDWTSANVDLEDLPAVAWQVSATTVSTSLQLDTSLYGTFDVTMSGDLTFTFVNPAVAGHETEFKLYLDGAFTPTFPATVKWVGGIEPTYEASAIYVFSTVDEGATWFGTMVGSAFA